MYHIDNNGIHLMTRMPVFSTLGKKKNQSLLPEGVHETNMSITMFRKGTGVEANCWLSDETHRLGFRLTEDNIATLEEMIRSLRESESARHPLVWRSGPYEAGPSA